MRWVCLVLSLLLAAPAVAQSNRNCASREYVLERLAGVYGETRQSIALGPNSAVVEVFANLETGTWTFIVTATNGTTCVVAAGGSYEGRNDPLIPTGLKV